MHIAMSIYVCLYSLVLSFWQGGTPVANCQNQSINQSINQSVNQSINIKDYHVPDGVSLRCVK